MAAATDLLQTTSFLLVAGGVVGGLLLWPEGSAELASWVFQPTTQSRGDKTSGRGSSSKKTKASNGGAARLRRDEPVIALDGYGRAVQVPPDMPVEVYGAYGLTPLPRAYQPGAAQDTVVPGSEAEAAAAAAAAGLARGPRGDFEYSVDPRAHIEALRHGVLGHWYTPALPDVSVSLLSILLATLGLIVIFGKLLGVAYDVSPTSPALAHGDAYVTYQCRVRREEKKDKKSSQEIKARLQRELAEVEREHIRREGGKSKREVERANEWRQKFEHERSKDDAKVKTMVREEGITFVQLDKNDHRRIRDAERKSAARAERGGSSRERSSSERAREKEKEKEKEKNKEKDKDKDNEAKKQGGRRSFGDWLRQTLLGRDGASTNGQKEQGTTTPDAQPRQIAPGVELVDDATAQQAAERHRRQAQQTAERLRAQGSNQ